MNVVNLTGSSASSKPSLYIWNFSVHILLNPILKIFCLHSPVRICICWKKQLNCSLTGGHGKPQRQGASALRQRDTPALISTAPGKRPLHYVGDDICLLPSTIPRPLPAGTHKLARKLTECRFLQRAWAGAAKVIRNVQFIVKLWI